MSHPIALYIHSFILHFRFLAMRAKVWGMSQPVPPTSAPPLIEPHLLAVDSVFGRAHGGQGGPQRPPESAFVFDVLPARVLSPMRHRLRTSRPAGLRIPARRCNTPARTLKQGLPGRLARSATHPPRWAGQSARARNRRQPSIAHSRMPGRSVNSRSVSPVSSRP